MVHLPDRPLGDLDVDPAPGALEASAFAAGADGEHLRHDRKRGLGGRVGADVEAARTRDARELLLAHPRLEEPLPAALLVPAGAERADVERLRREGAAEG